MIPEPVVCAENEGDDDAAIIASASGIGMTVTGCSDPQIAASCQHETFGETIRGACMISCGVCSAPRRLIPHVVAGFLAKDVARPDRRLECIVCEDDDACLIELASSNGFGNLACDAIPAFCGLDPAIPACCPRTCNTCPVAEGAPAPPPPPPAWHLGPGFSAPTTVANLTHPNGECGSSDSPGAVRFGYKHTWTIWVQLVDSHEFECRQSLFGSDPDPDEEHKECQCQSFEATNELHLGWQLNIDKYQHQVFAPNGVLETNGNRSFFYDVYFTMAIEPMEPHTLGGNHPHNFLDLGGKWYNTSGGNTDVHPNGTIGYSCFPGFLLNVRGNDGLIAAVRDTQKMIYEHEYFKDKAIITSVVHTYWTAFIPLKNETWKLLGFSLACMVVVCFVFLCSFRAPIVAVATCAMIAIEIWGCMMFISKFNPFVVVAIVGTQRFWYCI
jgi:hypothetical protein